MIEDGIPDGDLVAVQRAADARDGRPWSPASTAN